MADVIAAGVESGEFAAGTDVDRIADLGVALLDGTGVRALLGDPGWTSRRPATWSPAPSPGRSGSIRERAPRADARLPLARRASGAE